MVEILPRRLCSFLSSPTITWLHLDGLEWDAAASPVGEQLQYGLVNKEFGIVCYRLCLLSFLSYTVTYLSWS